MTQVKGVVQQLKKERERAMNHIQRIDKALAALGVGRVVGRRAKAKRKMSAEGRKRIAAAQRARWAKVKAKQKAAA